MTRMRTRTHCTLHACALQMISPCVVGVVSQWQYVVQLDWSACSVDEYLLTAGLAPC